MNPEDPKLIVALYLRGENLDPDAATRALGIQPTKARRRGERRTTSSGREFVVKLGLWALLVELESSALEAHLARLVGSLPQEAGALLTTIPGVEDAFLDVFVGLVSDSDGEARGELEVSPQILKLLIPLGLPIRFTITAGPD